MQQQQSNKKSRGGRILARKVATESTTSRAKGLGFHREKSLRSGNVFIGNQRSLTCINNFPSSVPESFSCHIYRLCCWWWWSLSHEQRNKSRRAGGFMPTSWTEGEATESSEERQKQFSGTPEPTAHQAQAQPCLAQHRSKAAWLISTTTSNSKQIT